MRMGTIYILENKHNKKCYVGQTINIKNRFRSYKSSIKTKKSPTYIERSILKYGWDCFNKYTYGGIPLNILDDIEIKMIEKINTIRPNGYNLESGGKKLKKHHPESNKKRSIALSGNKHPLYGTHLSEEAKKHLSDFWKGKTFSKSHLLHLSEASKGKPKSKYHKELCRIAAIGKNIGKDNGKAKAIICIETGEIFYAMSDACRKYKLHSGHLSDCCKGLLKTHGGYHWEYYKEAI